MFEDDGDAALQVGFIIDQEAAIAEMLRFAKLFDDNAAKFVRKAAEIESAAGGIKLASATSSVKSFASAAMRELATASAAFGDVAAAKEQLDRTLGRSSAMSTVGPAVTREAASTRAEINRTERSIDLLIGKLDREAAAVGRTREELRDMKIETLALTAAQQGNTDAADRLLTSARALSAARQAADEDRHALEMKAAAAAAREQATAEAALNGQLLERARLQAALDRTNGADRPRATSAGATFSALSAKAAEDEARATSMAAAAAKQAADEHGRLAAMVRGSNAAMEADAAAAERMRAATDPLYAATKRLNDELAESTRLYHNGATAPAEYARQQEVLTGRLRAATGEHARNTAAIGKNSFAMKQTLLQVPDIVQGLLTGQKPLTILIQQGGQIAQIAQMAEGGLKGFAREIGALGLAALPFAAAASVAGVALYRWKEQLDKGADLEKFAAGLGLTHKEMKKLGDQSITTGDMIAGLWKTVSDGASLGGSGKSIMDRLFSPDDAKQAQGFIASIYGTFAGGYDAVVQLWSQISSTVSQYVAGAASAVASFFSPVVAAAQWAGNQIGQIFSSIYNWVSGWLKSIGGAISSFAGPILEAMGANKAAAAVANAGKSLGTVFGEAYTKRAGAFIAGSNALVEKAGANIVDKAQARLKKQADAIKADRTPKTPKTDSHAATLVKDAEATEAQIRNLYELAKAYRISGAAALIAEAQVKAESKALKQGADIKAEVDRQIRLAIATRVSDAAKSAASMRDQVAAQTAVNAAVAAGLVPSERAADLVRDQLADLPLLAAQQVAQQLDLATAAAAATKALKDQQTAREDLARGQATAQFNSDMASGANRLAELREEQRLVGATDAARVHALATIRATQEAEAKRFSPTEAARYVQQQVKIADTELQTRLLIDAQNASLEQRAVLFDEIAQSVSAAGQGIANAFGSAGQALGDIASRFAGFLADQERLRVSREAELKVANQITDADQRTSEQRRIGTLYAARSSHAQIEAYGDMLSAAKGFFKSNSDGYKALATAEKVYRGIQFAMSVKAMAQDAIETGFTLAKSAARTAAHAVEAVARALASLPFPANLAAGAATAAALAAIGVSIAGSFGSGSKDKLAPANTGTGTVLGDRSAQSESLKRSIDALKDVDTLTNTYAREMANTLRSIDGQIGGLAAVIVRTGNIDASAGVNTGFKTDTTGKVLSTLIGGAGLFNKVPVLGSILGAVGSLVSSLFGSKTSVIGSGLFGKAQTIGSINAGGFDASYYSDVEKKKKFFGITTGTSYSTQYSAADPNLENQFTLILRQFNDAVVAAAGPLGASTAEIQNRLNGFVVNIGKIDLKGLTGEQIQEKLTAVFGAAADDMANAAFPGLLKLQKVGEGAFETLVRVASTLEAVGASFDLLGLSARGLSIDAKLGLAAQFDSVSDLTSAAQGYFEAFYSKEEQAAAKTAQLGRVFGSLGLAMPATIAGYRQLVDAQDLNTAAGQSTYATLLKLAPAFADLQTAMEGARSAADIASERQDLERRLLELRGDTAALRALDLAKLDASNRALQQQIYAIEDAQAAAKAAEDLRQAWKSVGDSITDEVKRIRGLATGNAGGGFVALQGQFNAASAAARGGDQDAAKSLPGLSQALLTAAASAASSRQELERIQAMTAASLEATNAAIARFASAGTAPTSTDAILAAVSTAQAVSAPAPANDDVKIGLEALAEEVAAMRKDMNDGNSKIAGNTAKTAKILDDVSQAGAGQALATVAA